MLLDIRRLVKKFSNYFPYTFFSALIYNNVIGAHGDISTRFNLSSAYYPFEKLMEIIQNSRSACKGLNDTFGTVIISFNNTPKYFPYNLSTENNLSYNAFLKIIGHATRILCNVFNITSGEFILNYTLTPEEISTEINPKITSSLSPANSSDNTELTESNLLVFLFCIGAPTIGFLCYYALRKITTEQPNSVVCNADQDVSGQHLQSLSQQEDAPDSNNSKTASTNKFTIPSTNLTSSLSENNILLKTKSSTLTGGADSICMVDMSQKSTSNLRAIGKFATNLKSASSESTEAELGLSQV